MLKMLSDPIKIPETLNTSKASVIPIASLPIKRMFIVHMKLSNIKITTLTLKESNPLFVKQCKLQHLKSSHNK